MSRDQRRLWNGRTSPGAPFHGRKRRLEDVSRDTEIPKRRRTEGEAGQKTDHAPTPIGFKALESICREQVPENAVLKLVSISVRFEALLCLEEIRPDLLKLVISSFRLLCLSNNIMTANAEKILRSSQAKKFITGTVLSRFINEMAYSSDSSFGDVITDLTVIFLAMIQRFGESIVHGLPLPQLSASFAALKDKNLIKGADDLEKKLSDVKELKDEVIRRARSARDQESAVEPPQNFREVSVIPEGADLLCSRPFVRENLTDRKFKDLDHYLDVQFRLLREDFVMPLRDGIKQLRKESNPLEPSSASSSTTTRRANDVSVYHDVTVLHPVCSSKGRVYRVRFNRSHPTVKNVKWERSKRLKFGSLVCLSLDEFNSFVFATVENRDADGLSVGELEVRFENVETAEINRFVQGKERFVMIESPAYFVAYRHVLEALKEIKADEFPFQRHIVECCPDVGPPEYHLRQLKDNEEGDDKEVISFNFAGVLVKTKPTKRSLIDYHIGSFVSRAEGNEPALQISENDTQAFHHAPPPVNSEVATAHVQDHVSPQQDQTAGVSTESSNNRLDVAMKNEVTHEIFNWPDRESLGFNESQMRAFKLALTKQFAVIQGPPGTGKTFVGLKIARALLENASLWKNGGEASPILMVSYTNHALDQFLEGLLPMKGIVRVGGRSKSEKLERYTLKSLKIDSARTVARARRTTKHDIRVQKGSYQRSSLLLKASRTSVISLNVFNEQKNMRRNHYNQFSALAWRRSINEELLRWLDIKRNDKPQRSRLENNHQRDDIQVEVEATPRYRFDNDDEFNKDANSMLREISVLSINDADNANYVRRNLAHNEVMSDEEERGVEDITRLHRIDRWRLYRLWRQRLEKRQRDYLQRCQAEFEEALSRDKELDTMVEYGILQRARVIGMTTTCAARYRKILQRICPKIVLVEEAAEVLEAHIITSLTKGCKHLILIGDHQQLRPTPTVYELAKKYKLDVSLFERMVNVGVQCERLSVQHRMRPEIAALMKHIYEDLKNHQSVEEYEDIKGMKKNMFFINHSHLENHNDESHSHTNDHEATFLVALCRYLLQQGYKAEQITLLTTYTGQMFAIKDCLSDEKDEVLKSVRLTTVDNFQGEENDIILLSLVRSNKNEKLGFIKIVNRACVALSRAKKGFYCIGNFAFLSKHSDIWSKIVADLKSTGSIGDALPIVCQVHSDEVTAETAEDFSKKVPDGGCLRRCEVRLKCGHACKLLCHPHDKGHDQYVCGEPCGRNIEGCNHPCPNRCSESCLKRCQEWVAKALPDCGHIVEVECGADLENVPCKERCDKNLSCGHSCQSYCKRPCTVECQELVKRIDWPCGHEVTIACSATPADCPVPCRDSLECGHQCSGTCGECRMGRVHKRCKLKCGRGLVCAHVCKKACAMPCPPCSRDCEDRCLHSSCPEKCCEPCIPCREPCLWECPHYKCYKKCHEICERPRCDVPCQKILPCYHVCRGLCQEECICAVCMKNDGNDPITDIFLGGEEDEDARFIKLPDCGHIFAVSDLDRYVDMSEDDTTDSQVIQMKTCPRCKTTIRLSLRYGNVIKQRLQDIEKVKKVMHNKISRGMAKKRSLLLHRLTHLSAKFNGESHERFWLTLQRGIRNLDNGLMAALLENKVMLMERFCLMSEKMKENLRILPVEVCKENNLEGHQVATELSYLQKRFMSDRVTQRELQDINTEFSRLDLQLEFCLLIHDVKSLKLELEELFRKVMTAVREELSSGKRIEGEKLDQLLKSLATIRRAYPDLNPLTPEEKKQIVSTVGLSKGHWYKCPQGHIYAIGECGGAMQRGTCPECGAVIGGESHRLEEGNELAPEMDGARFSAWSEQANLQNYEL